MCVCVVHVWCEGGVCVVCAWVVCACEGGVCVRGVMLELERGRERCMIL